MIEKHLPVSVYVPIMQFESVEEALKELDKDTVLKALNQVLKSIEVKEVRSRIIDAIHNQV